MISILILSVLSMVSGSHDYAGGWTSQNVESYLPKWEEIKTGATFAVEGFGAEDLSALDTPTDVWTQVVAGVNYRFEFADGSTIEVYEQSWTDTLEVTQVYAPGELQWPVYPEPENEPEPVEPQEPAEPREPVEPEMEPEEPREPVEPVEPREPAEPEMEPVEPKEPEMEPEEPKKQEIEPEEPVIVEPVEPVVAGGWVTQDVADYQAKWNEICQTATFSAEGYEAEDLAAFGQPVKVSTQVVAGVNYAFEFADGTKVIVLEQTWMNVLDVTNVFEGEEMEPEKPKKEKKKAKEPKKEKPKKGKEPMKPEESKMPEEKDPQVGGMTCEKGGCPDGFLCVFEETSGSGICEKSIPIQTDICADSPPQMCRMFCPAPSCAEGQCARRNGICCDFTCVDIESKAAPRQFGETCGYVPMIGEVGECDEGLDCACVGPCADPMVADAPSTCVPKEDFECPAEIPEPSSPCSIEYLKCNYGEECCCGECFPSTAAECVEGSWALMATDACEFPSCEPDSIADPMKKDYQPVLKMTQPQEQAETTATIPDVVKIAMVVIGGLLAGLLTGLLVRTCTMKRERSLDDVYMDIALDPTEQQEAHRYV